MNTTTDDAPADLAGKVRDGMARNKSRQIELAGVLGISQPAASRRLAGLTPFRLAELPAVARFLGVDVADLLGATTTTG